MEVVRDQAIVLSTPKCLTVSKVLRDRHLAKIILPDGVAAYVHMESTLKLSPCPLQDREPGSGAQPSRRGAPHGNTHHTGDHIHHTPVDGGWGGWSTWSTCSVTCGSGIMSRARECNNPHPRQGGLDCVGNMVDNQACNMPACPSSGAPPSRRGAPHGNTHHTGDHIHHTPVDGGWGGWSTWSTCSVTCGSGIMSRARECNNPHPRQGGLDCVGNMVDNQACNMPACPSSGAQPSRRGAPHGNTHHTGDHIHHTPVDGGWGGWSTWSTCSVTCGSGIMSRARECNNPHPRQGGLDCVGNMVDNQACNMPACPSSGAQPSRRGAPHGNTHHTGDHIHHTPVDGGWGGWSTWSTCSVTCGSGIMSRARECNNPHPRQGGLDCVGNMVDNQACNMPACPSSGAPPSRRGAPHGNTHHTGDHIHHTPVDGGWGGWSTWSTCSVTCGSGTMSRTRECNNPHPRHGGLDCVGNKDDNQACDMPACPINGNWGDWGTWSMCSASCGSGGKVRVRVCTNPAPSHGGQDCVGNTTDRHTCMMVACPTSTTTSTVAPVQATCNKICTISPIAEGVNLASPMAPVCANGSSISAEALPLNCCDLGSLDTWTIGDKVHAHCSSVSAYTAVGRFVNGHYEPGTAGVFLDCLDHGFRMAEQGCDKTPTIVHVDNSVAAYNPDLYYLIMSPAKRLTY